MALNLEKQLRFYGSYHHHPVNVGIHVTCVPAILVTSFLFATNSPAIPLPEALQIPNLPLNLGTFGATLYATLYVLMEPVAGGALAPFLIASAALSNYLTSTYGMTANYWALAVHVTAWIAQFIGHGKYEGRSPALVDNLVQALFLAPLFVWLEVLFKFGYRPELQARIDKGVEEDINKFKDEKAKRKAANGNGKVKGAH